MNLNALALRSLLVVIIGLLAAQTLKGRGAAIRHLVYAATLLSLLLLPLIRRWGPVTFVPPQVIPAPIHHAASAIPSLPATSAVNLAHLTHPFSAASPNILFRVAEGLTAVWALVSLILLLRIGLGLLKLASVVRRAQLIEAPGTSGHEVRLSHDVTVPSTAWLGRHMILLPAEYVEWPEERLKSVILHERAHIERRDWFVQMCGRLACALYWPNPLVWTALRRLLDTAEQAADDTVLREGVTPSRYAEDLLQIALSVRSPMPASVPMAASSDVGRRIRMVLDGKKRRGSVTLTTLVAAAVAVAGVSVPSANLMLSDIQSDRTSPYEDIREGRTISGCAENDFTATLEDGRHVRLIQIGKHMPDGTFQSWKPDGSTLARKDALPAQYSGNEKGMMEFVYRVSTAHENFTGAMGSGPSEPGEPPTQTFAGNWSLPPSKNGSVMVVSLQKVPQLGDSGQSSYSFCVIDGPTKSVAGWDASSDQVWSSNTFAKAVTVDANTTAKVFVDPPVQNKDGRFAMHTIPAVVMKLRTPGMPMVYSHRVVGYDAHGKEVECALSGGNGYGDFTYSFAASSQVKRIDVQVQRVRAADFLGVHLTPKGSSVP